MTIDITISCTLHSTPMQQFHWPSTYFSSLLRYFQQTPPILSGTTNSWMALLKMSVIMDWTRMLRQEFYIHAANLTPICPSIFCQSKQVTAPYSAFHSLMSSFSCSNKGALQFVATLRTWCEAFRFEAACCSGGFHMAWNETQDARRNSASSESTRSKCPWVALDKSRY